MTIDEFKKAIMDKAKKLATTLRVLREAEEYTKLTQKDKIKEIDSLEKQLSLIDNKIAKLRLEIDEADPENAKLVEDKQNEAERLRKEIKSIAYKIPVEFLQKNGIKVVDDDNNPTVTVSVSKAQTETSFDTEALLEEFPQLVSMEIDGDPVVIRSIDVAVLERLIEQGDVPEDVCKYQVIAKKRNPSVRISS